MLVRKVIENPISNVYNLNFLVPICTLKRRLKQFFCKIFKKFTFLFKKNIGNEKTLIKKVHCYKVESNAVPNHLQTCNLVKENHVKNVFKDDHIFFYFNLTKPNQDFPARRAEIIFSALRAEKTAVTILK